MEIQVGKHIRNVDLSIDRETKLIKGHVGTAFVLWNKAKYQLPLVRIPKLKTGYYVQQKIAEFVDTYLTLLQTKRDSTLPVISKEGEHLNQRSVKREQPTHISGVPLWALELKEWHECFKKDGSSYMRRTVYKKESLSLVREHVPTYCSHCLYRVTCKSLCESPVTTSTETI